MASKLTTEIQRRILSVLEVNDEGKYFVPCDEIEKLDILRPAQNCQVDNAPGNNSLPNVAVNNSAKRVFLILAKVNRLNLLQEIIAHPIDNRSLPLVGRNTTNTEDWKSNARHLFHCNQWEFLAPKFGGDTFFFEFDERRIMPFLWAEETLPITADTEMYTKLRFTRRT